MSDETKTITFDLDYMGQGYRGRTIGFRQLGMFLQLGLAAPDVLMTADEVEDLGINLIAAAEAIRRTKP